MIESLGTDPFTVLFNNVEESWKSKNTRNLWLGRQNHCQKLVSYPILSTDFMLPAMLPGQTCSRDSHATGTELMTRLWRSYHDLKMR